jgi:hypothetical protein
MSKLERDLLEKAQTLTLMALEFADASARGHREALGLLSALAVRMEALLPCVDEQLLPPAQRAVVDDARADVKVVLGTIDSWRSRMDVCAAEFVKCRDLAAAQMPTVASMISRMN